MNPEDKIIGVLTAKSVYVQKGFRPESPLASDYLVVPDPKHHSTWSLPVKENGKPNARLMGAAHAALTGDYRGSGGYAGPKQELALAKLRRLYAEQKMDWPDTNKSMTHPDDCTCKQCKKTAPLTPVAMSDNK